jgi:hypothetical protein
VVFGAYGEKVDWKSSCGGYSTTIVDGKNDVVTFTCGSTTVSEVVTCNFGVSSGYHTCSSPYGSCSGTSSCQVKLSGKPGTSVPWTSSCGGGTAYTILDGVSEVVYFKCQSLVTEKATCTFQGSTTTQTCSSSKGPSCSGITSCSLTLSGTYGETVYWKSTCGAGPTTILDGKNDSVVFSCPPTPPPVKEMVTCYFQGSNTYQTCYSPKGTCQGLLGCTIIVTGTMGELVTWKSSCGGYASTIMDGKDESAYFSCGPVVVDAGMPPPPIVDGGGWWP